MPSNNSSYLKWSVPEYRIPERSRNWYIAAGIFIFACLFFSFFSFRNWQLVFLGTSANYLFVLIIIMAVIIMVINGSRPPMMIKIEVGPAGIQVGRTFHNYDEFKSFAVLYKPQESVKNLYFEPKGSTRQRLSLPLRHMDPLTVRNLLIKYLNEDLERTEMPLSEQLTKLLKL